MSVSEKSRKDGSKQRGIHFLGMGVRPKGCRKNPKSIIDAEISEQEGIAKSDEPKTGKRIRRQAIV